MSEEKYTFFWGGPFSQWKFSPFTTISGKYFNCAEQYMMYQKAVYFEDLEIAEEILTRTRPKDQKALGRKVKGFVQEEWEKVARDIVFNGNWLKYTNINNFELKKALLETAGTILVEASPYDKIWGIGLAADDPRALNRDTWLGKNWLGETLTRVRDKLLTLE